MSNGTKHGCCVDGSCTPATCMGLPDEATCGQRAHLERCKGIFGCKPESAQCDWFPRKFRPFDAKEKSR